MNFQTDLNEIGEWVMIIGLLFGLIGGVWFGIVQQRTLNELEAWKANHMLDWNQFMERREKLHASLADPETILQELEDSATVNEMLNETRTTAPRQDAGPPAVVHRPQMKAAKPTSYNPRPPHSPER